MPKFRNYQTNFSGGLLSEGMLGRVDLAQYESGCKQLTNWWPKVTGGMRRRPGSLHLAFVDNALRIESFIFSESQTYIFVFRYQTGGVHIDNNNIHIYNPVTGELVATVDLPISFLAHEIYEMSITQKGDVMFLAHPLHRTLLVTRTSSSTFVLSEYVFETSISANGFPKLMPFIKFEAPQSTMRPNGYSRDGIVNLELVGATWTTSNNNTIVRYRGKQILITAIVNDNNATGVIKEELDQGAVLSFNASVSNPHDFRVGEIIVGRDSGVKAEVTETNDTSIAVAMIAGKFAALTTEEVEGLDGGNIAKILSFSNTNPPASADWDEEAFSVKRGWPGIVEFHSQRLWFGGSSSLPAHIFGSRVAAFFNFDAGDAFPADSIQAAIAGKQINNVLDIVSGRHLQIFTDAAEFYAPQSEDRPLEPLTFDLLPQTRYGTKSGAGRTVVPPFTNAAVGQVGPKVFDESTIFVQAQGSAIREFIWQDAQKGYSSDPISLIAEEHINDVKDVEVLYGGYDRPEQIAFFVNGDGSIVWYHAARAESIRTWGTWETQGNYKSLTVVQDKLYALVERATDSGTELALERFELDVTLDGAWQDYDLGIDAARSIWDFSGSKYNGITVQAVSGEEMTFVPFVGTFHNTDFYLGEYVMASGIVDLGQVEVFNITIGLGFIQTLEPMPIEIKDQNGVTGGMPKRIVSADVYMASTMAIQLNGHSITTFLGQNDLSKKPDPITGLRKFYLLGYSERPTVLIENRIPLPCEVLSLGAEVEY